jgi:hypothetical protein
MDWRDKASCRDEDPEIFFPLPSDGATEAKALAVCATCPVEAPCLEFALRFPGPGIYGGVTWRVREGMRYAAAPEPTPAEETKRCTRCNTHRRVSEFTPNDRTPDGLTKRCIKCNKATKRWSDNAALRTHPGASEGRQCNRCQQVKPLDAFKKDSRKPLGRQYSCTLCESARARDAYHANRLPRCKYSEG